MYAGNEYLLKNKANILKSIFLEKILSKFFSEKISQKVLKKKKKFWYNKIKKNEDNKSLITDDDILIFNIIKNMKVKKII